MQATEQRKAYIPLEDTCTADMGVKDIRSHFVFIDRCELVPKLFDVSYGEGFPARNDKSLLRSYSLLGTLEKGFEE